MDITTAEGSSCNCSSEHCLSSIDADPDEYQRRRRYIPNVEQLPRANVNATVLVIGDPSYDAAIVQQTGGFCGPMFDEHSVVFMPPANISNLWSPLIRLAKYWTGFGPMPGVLDIAATVAECKKKRPGRPVVIYARSQNAAAAFSYLCYASEDALPAFAVLEACPASVHELLEKRYGSHVADWLSWLLCMHRPASPMRSVSSFPKQVPVLFVTSESDRTVNWADTANLVQQLKQVHGHPNITGINFGVTSRLDHRDYWNVSPLQTIAYYNTVQRLLDTHVK